MYYVTHYGVESHTVDHGGGNVPLEEGVVGGALERVAGVEEEAADIVLPGPIRVLVGGRLAARESAEALVSGRVVVRTGVAVHVRLDEAGVHVVGVQHLHGKVAPHERPREVHANQGGHQPRNVDDGHR